MKYLLLLLLLSPIYAHAELIIRGNTIKLTPECRVVSNKTYTPLVIKGNCRFVNYAGTDAIRVVQNSRHFHIVMVESNTYTTAIIIKKNGLVVASKDKIKKSDQYNKDNYRKLAWGIK